MKATLKRLLSAVAAVAMTATCLSAATMPSFIAGAEDVNIALEEGVVAIADSVNEQFGGELSYANDGDFTTRWQSNASGKSESEMAWLGYNFGKSANFSKAVIYWETARASADGVRFLVSNNGTNWTQIDGVSTSSETSSKNEEDKELFCVEYTFAQQTAVFLKVEMFKLNNDQKANPSVWEFEVYGNFDVDTLAAALTVLQETIDAANALTESNYTPETWATLQDALAEANEALTSEDEAVISAATAAVNEAVAALEFDGLAKLAEAVAAANAKVTAENSYKFTADSKAVLNGYLAEAATYEGATVDETNLAAIKACTQNILNAIAALQTSNLAIGKDFILGSEQSDQLKGEYINDGDITTRWASNTNCSEVAENIVLNFGTATTVDRLEVYWETARPIAENVKIQYSQDGSNWADLDVSVAGSLNDTVADATYLQTYSFDAIKVKYIRINVFGVNDFGGNVKDKISIWEFEAYNTTGSELAEDTVVYFNFGTLGAQTRNSTTVDGAKDMRFVSAIKIDFWTENAEEITDIGVLLARADQLTAAGLTGDALTLGFANDAVIMKKLSAVYLNNSNNVDGYYEFYSTITGITDEYADRQYVAVAYYAIGDEVFYAGPVTRCVNG